ncbi:phenylacetate--CoA ligase family protein [Acuticoccus sediminis]|uniref:phenylacetate--CoA ligase family protein n=1 Tax=Acuticoccus sediminis TaxID=2184697 RepID=UPI001CFCFCD2|nr:AMP-binding protein [Acuticoccus sediminis]
MTQRSQGPSYFDVFDSARMARDYPVADFLSTYRGMSRDELHALQNARFGALMATAWKVPFYQRHWGAKGIEPGDIRSLDDLAKLPPYSKSDLMASVEAFPPFGDFAGIETWPEGERPPMVLQTTSGTTGKPQPLIWGPKGREVQNMILARIYLMQGMKRADVVHSVYGFGMVNGGHFVREAISHWVGAPVLTAGTGADMRSARQVQMMRDFGVTALVGFGDYLKRLADVAREEGILPGRDIRLGLISGHIGADSASALSEAWGGPEVYDWYGVGDTGPIAGQGPDRDGMHVMEDAQFLEILDVESGDAVPEGQIGDMVCTCLHKDDLYPIVRFNTHDVTQTLPGDNPLGLPFRRIQGFMGRSDNMVKLRGINIYPQGIGALLSAHFPEMAAEYVCRVEKRDGRDEMVVIAEVRERPAGLAEAMAEQLRTRLGVQIDVELAGIGETAHLTEIEQRQKPIRLIDRRKDA